ncbi:MAG: hypothetical protein WD069_18125 [Planctomycetales bacterium]
MNPARRNWSRIRRRAGRRLAAAVRVALLVFCAAASCFVPVKVQLADEAAVHCRCSSEKRAGGRCCCRGRETLLGEQNTGRGCCAERGAAPARACCASRRTAAATGQSPHGAHRKPPARSEEQASIRACPCGGGGALSIGGAEPRFAFRRPEIVPRPDPPAEWLTPLCLTGPQAVLIPETPPPEVRRV